MYTNLMQTTQIYIQKQLIWRNILFFGITIFLSLVGLPLYIYFVGLGQADWWLFLFMCAATMMSTTFGYHRFFAHRSFKTHPAVEFLCLFFGAAAFEQSALVWASQHRYHHRYTDTDRDPYNIKRGFFYAHMGWFLFSKHVIDLSNVQDLSAKPMVRHQHRYWLSWAIFSGILLPLFVGYLTGHFWGAAIFGVITRLVVIHQAVFLINSACHMFGSANYDGISTARDSWVCALLTNGEGYHNFHHAFPGDYRNGIRWYHWDPTKWLIEILSWTGLTWDLKRSTDVQILGVRIEERYKNILLSFQSAQHPKIRDVIGHVTTHYEKMKTYLKHWEAALIEYRRLCQADPANRLRQVSQQMKDARQNFFRAYRQWTDFVNQKTVLLQPAV